MRLRFYLVLIFIFSLSFIVIAKEINIPKDCKTIEQAIQKASSGDVILLSEGIYHETLRVEKDNIALRGIGPEKVKIISESNDKSILVIEGVQSFKISGVTFQYSPNQEETKEDAIATINIKNSTGIKLENCHISENKYIGIQFINSTGEVASAVITKAKKTGLLIQGNSSTVNVVNSQFEDAGTCGIVCQSGAKASLVKTTVKNCANGVRVIETGTSIMLDQCEISHCGEFAVNVLKGSKCNIKSSTVHSNIKGGILVSGQEALLEANNCFIMKHQNFGVVVDKGAKCLLSNNTCKENRVGYLCQGKDSEIDITQDTIENNINALVFSQGAKANVKQCKITNSSERVIFSQDEGTRFIAYQCELVNNKRVAITVTNGSHGKIDACKINQNATGVSISKKSSAEVTNCTLFGNKIVGIHIREHSQGIAIRGNTIKNMDTFGIVLSNNSQADILENTIESVKTGISVCSSCTASISKNKLINNQQGIRCLKTCKVTTDSNVFEGNKEHCFVQLNEYILKGKYDLLESIANELRDKKSEINGYSDILPFYEQLNKYYDFTNSERIEALAKSYDKWIEARPDSTTALIAKAAMHINYAWSARGTGFSHTVSEQGRQIFEAELKKADKLLIKVATNKINDIGLYHQWLAVAMGLSKPKDQTDTIFQKALTIDPDCIRIYFSMTTYLLPRWYGEHGDVQAFAMQARQYPKKLKGDVIYALIAGHMLQIEKKEEYSQMGFSYNRIVAGYKTYHEIYPNDKKSFCALAMIAYREEDMKTFADALDVVGNDYDNTFWASKASFKKYRKIALDYRKGQKDN